MIKYVNLIIDNSSDSTDRVYTYKTDLPKINPGDKVKVSFGQGNRVYDAFVFSVSNKPDPRIKRYKSIKEKDEEVFLPKDALAVSEWMRERYFSRYIDCIKCFAPVGEAPKRRKLSKVHLENVPEKISGPTLTKEQEKVLSRLGPALGKEKHDVFLLHGVTGSGKTEIYIRAIKQVLEQGKSAIMLVPEIALTGQMINRFQERLGAEKIAVLHSRLTRGERYDQWMRLKNAEASVVIGARSAVFAPLDNLGIIILDEEHEATYKSDMNPKYDTIEVAIERGKIHEALVLLGSATPSIESSYKANTGDYKLVSLKERYNKNPLPSVNIVDMREELKEGNRSIFSRELYEEMEKTLDEGRQIILFLNRRGHSTFISCRNCGYALKCDDCNISMTFHKGRSTAICHYCGRRERVPKLCPVCASKHIRYFGAGTEKVEEVAKGYFGDFNVERLDLDTTRRKGSIEKILEAFDKGETHILVGTQLVAKGLDFTNVGLVGIVAADITLNIPDFRSAERTFQLITQAAGRTGRGDEPGKVVVQTYNKEHYAIIHGGAQDYESFYKDEIALRNITSYPPFSTIIYMVVAASTVEEAEEAASKIKATFLRWTGKDHEFNILGPKQAPLGRARGLYRYQLFIKCPQEYEEIYWKTVKRIKEKVYKEKQKEWLLSVDVNPFGFL